MSNISRIVSSRCALPAVLAMALALAGCASMPSEPDSVTLARYQAFAGEPIPSIPYPTSSGFTTIDDEHVLLTVRPTEAYLMKLAGPCLTFDRNSPSLIVTSSLGRIQARFDRVGVLSQPGIACIIQEIRPVDLKAMREAERAASDAS